jgi:hypothetical protein
VKAAILRAHCERLSIENVMLREAGSALRSVPESPEFLTVPTTMR